MSATQPPDAVEQRHRDAAAPIMKHFYGNKDGTAADTLFEGDVRRGDFDEHYIVQAFAAFEATLRPAIIAEERAATVAWLRAREIWWAAEVERYQRAGNPGPYLGSPSYGSMAASIERGDHEQKGPSRG